MTTKVPEIPVVLPGSSINRSAADLGRAPEHLQPLARRLIEHGAGARAEAEGRAGQIRLSMDEYSVPIETVDVSVDMASKAAQEASGWWNVAVFPAGWSIDAKTTGNLRAGTLVPMRFRPGSRPTSSSQIDLLPGAGNDALLLIEDVKANKCWRHWMFRQNDWNALHLANLGPLLAKSPYTVGICNAGTSLHRPYGPGADPRGERGMGLIKRALVTTAAEVASGRIGHAAELSIEGTWYCDDLRTAREGVDWLAPARRCEWVKGQKGRPNGFDPSRRALLSPEGLRVAFWVDRDRRRDFVYERVSDGPMRAFWVVIVDQWCDYGFIVAETGGYGMRQEMTGLRGSDRKVYVERWGWDPDDVVRQEAALADFANVFIDDAYVVNPVH